MTETAPPDITKGQQRVLDSYRRCFVIDEFFDDFYDSFLASSEEVRAMFKETDFDRQKKILAMSLNYLVMYACHPDFDLAKEEVERLAAVHDHNHMNVKPHLYNLWVYHLLKTIEKHDPQCDAQLLQEWQECLEPAIHKMQESY